MKHPTSQNKGLLLLGPFTEADFARFTALLREIERDRSEELFSFVMVDDSLTLDEARDIIKRTFPRRERVN